ncbi:MAG: hypothetical protein AB8F95_11185 [Bacteroidia bacterium]
MRFVLIISSLFIVLIVSPLFGQNASKDSCTCVPISVDSATNKAELIFFGEVLGVETNWMSGGMKYTFRVNGSWKQPTPEVFYLKSGWDDNCGAFFNKGERYLIFANKNFTAWRTTRCMPNQVWDNEKTTMLEGFGQSFTPTAETLDKGKFAWTIGLLGAGSILFFLLLIGRAWLRRKKE